MSSAERYFEVVPQQLGRNPGNLRFRLEGLFATIDLNGRTVLDIGAGDGHASFYAACLGARRVVSLEPEQEGSTPGARARFRNIGRALDTPQVELRPERLQDFDSRGERFDVLVSLASINHLDEWACAHMVDDRDARARYRELLTRLADLTASGGTLIIADCSSRNLFARLGVTNPFVPTIEWHKHQPPQLWIELLREVGYRRPRVRWTSFNTLRRAGWVLLGNRPGAYLLMSSFTLWMERD